ncbi:insoluble matrix shell protein 5-like [Mercenaria mercenaria]|uniref:insoluble matrix shell protein 5-like n=1 Tax=Mercenaria mercenaria TaxID=6596 RepID=UPI00234E8D1A|nr:insoluble matrix shell protein 5-like [Mercenaria mercenaria]
MLTVAIVSACIALCSSATWQIPHGHDLKVIVDNGFKAFDTNHDGVLSFQELEIVYQKEDLNHDGNLTLAEYASYWHTTQDVLAPIYNVWDKDGDGYVQPDHMLDYKHLLDPNGDGTVSLHEYEHYMTGFLECVYGHGEHGHGHNCDH